jgi:hypothetical protein
MKTGNQSDLARLMGVDKSTVTTWKKRSKLNDLILPDGRINLTKALKVLPGRISPKQQTSVLQRWKKSPAAGSSATKKEIKSYLDESMGDLSKLDIYELQRRNELEKLLLAQIKRRDLENKYLLVEDVKKTIAEMAVYFKDACQSIPDRCAALCAAEDDPFQCKQILIQETRWILQTLSDRFLKLYEEGLKKNEE